MPDRIRITDTSIGACPGRSLICTAIASALAANPTPARAEPALNVSTYIYAVSQLDRHEAAALGLTLGILFFAVVTAIMLVRTRRRLAATEAAARDEALALRAKVERANALLLSEPQVVIAWSTIEDEPEITGDPRFITDIGTPISVLEFGQWLDPDQSRAICGAVEALRARGTGFALTLTTPSHRLIEVDGQAIGGRAVLRLRNVSGIRHELAELMVRYQKQIEQTDALRTLVEETSAPIWARDAAGRLVYVNKAYVRAVEGRDGDDVVERGIELFDRTART